jgi:cytoskeletal protein RodZ
MDVQKNRKSVNLVWLWGLALVVSGVAVVTYMNRPTNELQTDSASPTTLQQTQQSPANESQPSENTPAPPTDGQDPITNGDNSTNTSDTAPHRLRDGLTGNQQ